MKSSLESIIFDIYISCSFYYATILFCSAYDCKGMAQKKLNAQNCCAAAADVKYRFVLWSRLVGFSVRQELRLLRWFPFGVFKHNLI